MHDTFTIIRNGKSHEARRFLREDAAGRVYQTVFFLDTARCDPAVYARFASDDPAMNAAADAMLIEMMDEADNAQKGRHR
jgi:hypothetical protein